MQTPNITSYGKYGGNYGIHTLRLEMPGMTIWYSYRTVVAYRDAVDGLVVSTNEWSTTTGKHLNWIDGGDKGNRVSGEVFDTMLSTALERRFRNGNDK